jgi:epoxyqueuosine reductase QueG
VAQTYGFHIYTVVNQHLDETAVLIAGVLQEAGHAAVPVPTSLSVTSGGYLGPMSHKLAARAAGHGWIGRSCLLVTPTAGPRIRLVTVLTDAPLPVAEPIDRDCRACTECVDACPAGAFTGRPFDPSEPIEARMDVRACTAYRTASKVWSGAEMCGVCVAVCPHGRRGRARRMNKA